MRARQTREWWKKHYDNWLESKLSIGEYSNNNGMSKSTFYGWIKKFRKIDSGDTTVNSKVQWATLTPNSSESISLKTKETSSLKITIGKASIEITSEFDSNLLSSVIKVLMDNA